MPNDSYSGGIIIQMSPERWVKKLYLAGRREFRTNPRLGEYWDRADAGLEESEGEEEAPVQPGRAGWKEAVRKAV